MFDNYKIFILNKYYSLSLQSEIILIILFFFIFIIIFSIFYNIMSYINYNYSYKKKLINLEKNLLVLQSLYNKGKIDNVKYKKKLMTYQNHIKKLL